MLAGVCFFLHIFICNTKPRLLSTLTFYICLPICLRWLQFSVPEWNRQTLSRDRRRQKKREEEWNAKTERAPQGRTTLCSRAKTQKKLRALETFKWIIIFYVAQFKSTVTATCVCVCAMTRVLPLFSMVPDLFSISFYLHTCNRRLYSAHTCSYLWRWWWCVCQIMSYDNCEHGVQTPSGIAKCFY